MLVERVIVYIDGFNFYYGLRDSRLDSSRWLDLTALSLALLRSGQQLELVRYFTARVAGAPAKQQRQATYLDVLSDDPQIEIDYGHFLSKTMSCRHCGSSWKLAEEKKTDVNIAVRLLEDAYDDPYDTAVLVSGDSDLAPALVAVANRFPKKRLLVAFPPSRDSAELRKVATAHFSIPANRIRACRLPVEVTTTGGVRLRAPSGWLPKI